MALGKASKHTGGRRLAITLKVEMLFVGLAALATVAGAMIVVLIGASVAMRYLVNAPLHFTEELVSLLLVVAFFLSLPLATLRAKHVRVLIFVNSLPNRARRWVAGLASTLGVVFCLWFFALCMPWLEFAFERNIKTEVARLLMYPWMALIPLSLLLTALAFVLRAIDGEQVDPPIDQQVGE